MAKMTTAQISYFENCAVKRRQSDTTAYAKHLPFTFQTNSIIITTYEKSLMRTVPCFVSSERAALV